MAKKFFYVCAGICLLACSLDAFNRRAAAQIAMQPEAWIDDANVSYANGSLLYAVHLNAYSGIDAPPTSIPLPSYSGTILSATTAVGGSPAVIADAFIVYYDGAVFQYQPASGWRQVASMTGGGQTTATSATWGQVKSTYRK